MKSFYQYSMNEIEGLLREQGLSSTGGSLLYNWHYKRKMREPLTHNFSKLGQQFLRETMHFDLPEIVTVQQSTDLTVKFLLRLEDGQTVETVLIPFQNKYSVCLSSQVGCAMKCSFCFTGTQGLKRHLSTEEIVGQFMRVQLWLAQNRPTEKILNIVFMGQGEPLHNFEAVKKACEIFLCQHGLSLARHRVTISTSGYLPGIKKWAQGMWDVNLALSLHSPFKEKRDELIPLNKTYPLEEVLEWIHKIPLSKKRFVTYEYLMIKDFNDAAEDAHELARLLKGRRAILNLIPFNPFPGAAYQRPALEKVLSFREILVSYGLPTMMRTTKGDDILAACGQLKS